MRDLTVPRGTASRSAISLCERPSRYASDTTSFCSEGNSAKAACTRSWRSFSATASSGSGSDDASARRHSGSSCHGTSRRSRSILRLRAMANTQVVMLPLSPA